MGIANCGGRVRDLGMFLLSFGLLSTQRERERERERGANLMSLEEGGVARRKEKGFWILGR